ncbi:MAG: DUF4861 family protein [Pricia sp.]|nr:DUF4861 family protein [Pricia sp.]
MKKKIKMGINKKKYLRIGYAIATLLLLACSEGAKNDALTVEVTNHLDFPRNEIVAIKSNRVFEFLNDKSKQHIRVKRDGSMAYLRTQWFDKDQDGTHDELLFQVDVAANSTTHYLISVDSAITETENDVMAYSRLVPERTDDYTWENDKVAFRTYGPTGEKEALAGVPGSTLSSGIDLWLKRTDKSIINKWYNEHLKAPGYYHIDHGEGYDPYHVGGSRGTGGIGVYENDSLVVSNNFTESRTLAAGPLRTVFELDYAPWSDYEIKETKRITLDLGSNFSKFDIKLTPEKEVPNYAVGITLHENQGEAKLNVAEGWFRHWETIDGSQVGEGIVIDPVAVETALVRQSEVVDQSNLLIVTSPQNNLVYYAGFAWDKSDQIATVEDWDMLLQRQALIISNPLEITIKK